MNRASESSLVSGVTNEVTASAKRCQGLLLSVGHAWDPGQGVPVGGESMHAVLEDNALNHRLSRRRRNPRREGDPSQAQIHGRCSPLAHPTHLGVIRHQRERTCPLLCLSDTGVNFPEEQKESLIQGSHYLLWAHPQGQTGASARLPVLLRLRSSLRAPVSAQCRCHCLPGPRCSRWMGADVQGPFEPEGDAEPLPLPPSPPEGLSFYSEPGGKPPLTQEGQSVVLVLLGESFV